MEHDPSSAIPDQHGRTAVVTGATSGIGLRVAEVLAAHGARVMITARDESRGAAALARIAAVATGEPPRLVELELTDPDSVRAAAASLREWCADRIDLLINNAGRLARRLERTAEGVETQWATNVFGPAALTWLLLPAIERVPASRVVAVSSLAHRDGVFDVHRLAADTRLEGGRAYPYYARTKLANLLLARELEQHFRRVGAESRSVAAHPGLVNTRIAENLVSPLPAWVRRATPVLYGLVSQSAAGGALPVLYAATAPGVAGAQYFGPSRWFETRGAPMLASRSAASESDELGALLLDYVETAVGLPAPR